MNLATEFANCSVDQLKELLGGGTLTVSCTSNCTGVQISVNGGGYSSSAQSITSGQSLSIQRHGLEDGGETSLVINDKNTASTPRRVKVTVKGRKATYPVVGADSPVQAIVTLGDATAAENGLCGESAYLSTSCAFNTPQNKLTCRR